MQRPNLYRSRNDRMLLGVCGGLAEYLNMDSTLIRVLWVLFIPNLALYFIAALFIPNQK